MPKHIEIKDAADRKELGQAIADMWREDNLDRDDWLRDLPKWLNAYQGRPEPKDEPWEGASNLFVPLTAVAVNTIHPKIMAALNKPDPICGFRPQEPSDEDLARKRERFLDYVLREEINIFPLADRFIQGMLVNGIQVVKPYWKLETKNIRTKHEFPLQTDPIEAIQAILTGEQAYAEAITRLTDESYEVVMKGRKVVLDVERSTDKLFIYTEREEVVYDAPAVDLIDPEDITFNSDCPYDLQQADHIIERYTFTLDQIKKKVKTKVFHASKDELKEIETASGSGIDTDDETEDVITFRENVTGAQENYREGSPYDLVELFDAYIKWDIDDDGYDEDIIVTVPKKLPHILLRVVRLEEVYRHGMKPFVLFYYDPISKTIWARGLPQIVEGLQTETNIIHNQRVDSGEINNRPWGWATASAGVKAERLPLIPGYLNLVQDVNQVRMHTPANYHAWPFQEEALLNTYFEKLTKISDITLGRIGEVQGAARTATGVQALSAQQATGFDIIIRRVQEAWKQLLQQIMALYAAYMPPGRYVRITGELSDPDYIVSKSDLTGKMDMVFTGNSLNTDSEIERNTTTFLAQTVLSPNVLSFLLQLGIINPTGIAELYRHFLQVFDVPKLERILVIPEMPETLKPDEIVNKLISGEKLLPKQGENHNDVIMLIARQLESPDLLSYSPEIQLLLKDQIKLRQAQIINEQVQQMMMIMQMAQMNQLGQLGQQMPMLPGQGGAPPQLQPARQGLTF